ncbi:unnamed protein product [Parajaminaea phylloscopi]
MVFQVRGSPIGWTSILIAVLASMGGFLFGYDTGQISNITAFDDFRLRFATGAPDAQGIPEWNSWIEGLIVGALSIGTAIGCILGAPVADKLGRRRAMSIECLIFTIGVIIQVTSFNEWAQVAVGRGVTGVGVGALSSAVPLYQSETVPRQVRGALVATYQLFITFGILIAYAFGIGTRTLAPSSATWRLLIALGIAFALILGIGIQFCPESPRWLAAHGRYEEAYRSLARVRGVSADEGNPYVEQEYADILAAIEHDKQLGASSWAECFYPRHRTLYRTLLGIVLQAGQQLTGANYFFYYGTTIFTAASIKDQFISQLILGAVNFVCTFGGLWILERFGRRRPLIYGAAWMVVWLCVFAGAGVGGDTQSYGIACLQIVAACFFIAGYAVTWAPGIWLFVGESFSLRTRAKQASLATLSNWVWNFCIGFFTKPITDSIGYNYGFVFAGANALNFFVAYFFVYETEKLTLEQIDEMYNSGIPAWKSVPWVPHGYSSRDEVKDEEKKADQISHVSDPKPEWRAKPDDQGREMDATRKAPRTTAMTGDTTPNDSIH